MADKYLSKEDYSKALTATLNDFEEALTYRWREEVLDSFKRTVFDIPCAPEPLRWPIPPESYGHYSAGSGEFCGFLTWVIDGQNGWLGDVSCDGWNSNTQKKVDCYAKSALEQVEQWAWHKRQQIQSAVPQLEVLDLAQLETAFNTFVRLGSELYLVDENSVGQSLGSSRDLVYDIEWLANNDHDRGWFTEWTGLAAEGFKDGFLASVKPTLRNQSILLGCLAGLYSDRAAGIEATRNNTLEVVKWATKTLNEKQTISMDMTTGLKILSNTGTALGVIKLLGGVVAKALGPVGVGLSVLTFLGQELAKSKLEIPAHSLPDAFGSIDTEVQNLHRKLDDLEAGYDGAIKTMQGDLGHIQSKDLELYDLTQNNAGGAHAQHKGKGFIANVSTILEVSQRCYEAAEGCSLLLKNMTTTSAADGQLAGRGGAKTPGDTSVVALRDELESFIKTTCARFLLAGDQIMAAAKAYAKTDAEQERLLNATVAAWREEGIGRYNKNGVDLDPSTPSKEADPSGHVKGTDRSKAE
jgi:hypothetical protein